MPRYTFQAGAHWPNSLIDLTNYEDADNSIGTILAQIKSYQEAGDYDAAQEIIRQYAEVLKNHTFDAAYVNKYVEELRNLEIYTKAKKQQIFYEPSEDTAATYATLQDVWIGNIGDGSSVITTGDALASQVLEGATFVGADGELHIGTMPDIGAVSVDLSAGETYTIPAGYHNGGGTVYANGGTPSGGTANLGTFSANGTKKISEGIATASAVQFRIAVPTVMTGKVTINKTPVQLELEQTISQFAYITGMNGSTVIYSAKFKDANGKWQSKTSKDGNGITAISGNTLTLKWSTEVQVTYYAW